MPKPVCVKCREEMYPEKNGVGYLQMASFGPCELWDADLWKCRSCGIEILRGFGFNAVAHHWQSERFVHAIESYEQKGILITERRKDDDSREDTGGKEGQDQAMAGERQSRQ